MLFSDRLSKLTKIVMGCLLASVSVATTQSIVSLYCGNNTSVSSSSASNSLSTTNDDLVNFTLIIFDHRVQGNWRLGCRENLNPLQNLESFVFHIHIPVKVKRDYRSRQVDSFFVRKLPKRLDINVIDI